MTRAELEKRDSVDMQPEETQIDAGKGWKQGAVWSSAIALIFFIVAPTPGMGWLGPLAWLAAGSSVIALVLWLRARRRALARDWEEETMD